jgi:hypothetical protein
MPQMTRDELRLKVSATFRDVTKQIGPSLYGAPQAAYELNTLCDDIKLFYTRELPTEAQAAFDTNFRESTGLGRLGASRSSGGEWGKIPWMNTLGGIYAQEALDQEELLGIIWAVLEVHHRLEAESQVNQQAAEATEEDVADTLPTAFTI